MTAPTCPLCGSPTEWARAVKVGCDLGGGLALAQIVRRRQCTNCGAYLRNDDEETGHDDD